MNGLCRAALVSARLLQIRNLNIGALLPINTVAQATMLISPDITSRGFEYTRSITDHQLCGTR